MICQRPAHKTRGLLWEFVGGKVEPGETKEQALIRECREELDVLLSVDDIFMEVTHEYPDITVHLTLFNATLVEGEPQKLVHYLFNNFLICWTEFVIVDLTRSDPFDIVMLQLLRFAIGNGGVEQS